MNNELKGLIRTVLKTDDFIQWDGNLVNKKITQYIKSQKQKNT